MIDRSCVTSPCLYVGYCDRGQYIIMNQQQSIRGVLFCLHVDFAVASSHYYCLSILTGRYCSDKEIPAATRSLDPKCFLLSSQTSGGVLHSSVAYQAPPYHPRDPSRFVRVAGERRRFSLPRLSFVSRINPYCYFSNELGGLAKRNLPRGKRGHCVAVGRGIGDQITTYSIFQEETNFQSAKMHDREPLVPQRLS
jgi:hypothetical protein